MLRKVGMVPLKNPQHFVTNDFHLISDSAEIFDRHSESLVGLSLLKRDGHFFPDSLSRRNLFTLHSTSTTWRRSVTVR